MSTAAETLNAYGTAGEKAFLDQLARNKQAATLLSNYIAAADKRAVWNGINKAEVLLYAQLLLGNAEAARHTAQRAARATS